MKHYPKTPVTRTGDFATIESPQLPRTREPLWNLWFRLRAWIRRYSGLFALGIGFYIAPFGRINMPFQPSPFRTLRVVKAPKAELQKIKQTVHEMDLASRGIVFKGTK